MSILNIAWAPDRVLVGVDTIAGALGAWRPMVVAGNGECSKLVYLSAGVVLAIRGPANLLGLVAAAAALETMGTSDGQCVDRLVARLPLNIRPAVEHAAERAEMAGIADGAKATEFEVAVVGWSSTAGRMRAVLFWQKSAADGMKESELDNESPSYATPWGDEQPWPPVPDAPSTAEGMHALAQLQVGTMAAIGEPGKVGGRSIVVELMRGRAAITERACQDPATQ